MSIRLEQVEVVGKEVLPESKLHLGYGRIRSGDIDPNYRVRSVSGFDLWGLVNCCVVVKEFHVVIA